MQPLSFPSHPMTSQPQPDTPARGSEVTDNLTPAQQLNRIDQLVLNHQELILSAMQVVKCLNTCFEDRTTDNFEELINAFENLTDEQEQSGHLKKMVYAFEGYFPASKIYRPDGKERWEATSALKAISDLSTRNKQSLITALRACNIEKAVPLKINPNSYVFVLGATVPGMQNRLNYLSCELLRRPDARDLIPEQLVGVVSSRPLNPEKDQLRSKNLNTHFLENLSDLPSSSDDKTTEAQGFMALADTLCLFNAEHILTWLPTTVCYTGPLSYKPQILQPNGQYILQEAAKSGRPNTEATIKSALTSLNLPTNAELVLVSSQPHVAAQQVAAERVATLLDMPLTIKACGRARPLKSDESIYQAIDALRKSIQLLNPNYHVTTNQTSAPEFLLIKSEKVNEWVVQKKPPAHILI